MNIFALFLAQTFSANNHISSFRENNKLTFFLFFLNRILKNIYTLVKTIYKNLPIFSCFGWVLGANYPLVTSPTWSRWFNVELQLILWASRGQHLLNPLLLEAEEPCSTWKLCSFSNHRWVILIRIKHCIRVDQGPFVALLSKTTSELLMQIDTEINLKLFGTEKK